MRVCCLSYPRPRHQHHIPTGTKTVMAPSPRISTYSHIFRSGDAHTAAVLSLQFRHAWYLRWTEAPMFCELAVGAESLCCLSVVGCEIQIQIQIQNTCEQKCLGRNLDPRRRLIKSKANMHAIHTGTCKYPVHGASSTSPISNSRTLSVGCLYYGIPGTGLAETCKRTVTLQKPP